MTVKRVKQTDGVFTSERIHVDLTSPNKGDFAALRESLSAADPAARIQRLEAFADAIDLRGDDAATRIRVKRLREYLTRANEVAVDGSYGQAGVALIRAADLVRREIEALPHTLKGLRFSGNVRGLTRLYREAVAVLEREGVDTKTKTVCRVLEKSGVVRVEGEFLHWHDDKKRQKRTPLKQFETGLSRHRTRIR